MKRFLLIALLAVVFSTPSFAQLKANFGAQECVKEVYYCGFDSIGDLTDWKMKVTNNKNTWCLSESPAEYGNPPFSDINPDSKLSLAIWFNDANPQDETMFTPEIDIPANASLSFYANFDGVFILYSKVKIFAVVDGQQTEIFDAFMWANENGHERPRWIPFNISLADYAGKKVSFAINYKGQGGTNFLMDDLKVLATDNSETSKVQITTGNLVHYEDMSEGNPTSWSWSFPGGTPETSTEQNPVVRYNKSGTYSATLVVKDAAGESTYTRNDFVVVKDVAPTTKMGLPEGGYLSPFTACFLPVNTEVQYFDNSTGMPTEWEWRLPGTKDGVYTEQNPKVTYVEEGVFDAFLRSTNKAGTSIDNLQKAITVGGTQYIWNITLEENSQLGMAQLGFYGYYGGTNWLDIYKFAEHFNKPLSKGSISEVDIYFGSVASVTPDADITVSICTKGADGMPDKELASASVKVKDLKYSNSTYLPTTFKFAKPVEIDEEFFVVVGGFPNNSTDTGSDAIAMFTTPERDETGKAATYQYLAVLDEQYQPTGECEWLQNTDTRLSFALAPKFTYGESAGVENVEAESNVSVIAADGELRVNAPEGVDEVQVYNISGQMVARRVANGEAVVISELEKGIYVVKVSAAGKAYIKKVIL